MRDSIGEAAWHRAVRLERPDPEGSDPTSGSRSTGRTRRTSGILPIGAGAEVLEPLDVRERVLAVTRRVLERYEAPVDTGS